jgi:transcription elongation GreA/GreB family factor
MDSKKALVQLFEGKIAEMLRVITQSALEAHAAATHEESKAEDQYDTRGLEASYLAGAQSRRAMELEEMLNTYRFVDLKTFDGKSAIASTALIELQPEEGAPSLYLLMPNGGGMSVDWKGRKVQTITPQSPLGSALLGKRIGDEIGISVEGKIKDFEIISIQ